MWVIIVIFVIMLAYYIWARKLHIDFGSFFKKGFIRIDNLFGVTCFCGKQGRGKTYSAVEQIERLIKNGQCEVFITNLLSYYDELRKEYKRDGV